ncbi:MAG: carbon-nitrogen hydrolase family protein [Phycisphaerae bacterium]|nr:carbon-nitrogen hydrolase family protein [Phycisphaerae bacterium]
MKLTLATCQFPVDADIYKNLDFILRQMKTAKRGGGHVAHFSEACLSGYAGVEFKSFHRFDWELLTAATRKIMALAKELRLWVILGSSHRLSGKHKPHNCLYIINDRGQLLDRYDKMFCTGDPSGKTGDLKHYTPGSHFCLFTIRGIRCGVLICHDFRYDELYRVYKRRGVQLTFHSYHNAHQSPAKLRKYNIWGTIVPATMQTYAANNYMWISANNSSRPASCWPSFFVRPDGTITGKLTNNRPGVLISKVDTAARIYDASQHWRNRALRGLYHSGKLLRDPRSNRRRSL